jgi:glycosyltransferase involved in cell wall biosynthesis
MKVIVASTDVPFVGGGGTTAIVDWLGIELERAGHEVDILRFPFVSETAAMLDQSLALRLFDLGDAADRVICIRPPSYLLPHPRKVLWFIHHHRPIYDLWRTTFRDVPDTPWGWRHARALVRADEVAFAEAHAIFANSHVVADRLRRFNNVAAEVVYPPIHAPERFRCDGYGDEVVYVSRATEHKRQHLAVEAMRLTRTPVKLRLIGRADTEAYGHALQTLIARYDLGGRVTFTNAWASEADKIDALAACLATLYIPLDEDSYGYSSLEAHHAGKAVITGIDSGGTAELIVDGKNGLIVPPEPRALAEALDRLYDDRALAQRLGEAGPAAMARLGITWDRVLERLLA